MHAELLCMVISTIVQTPIKYLKMIILWTHWCYPLLYHTISNNTSKCIYCTGFMAAASWIPVAFVHQWLNNMRQMRWRIWRLPGTCLFLCCSLWIHTLTWPERREKRAKLKDKCNHIVLLKDRFSFFKSIFKQNWHANIKWVVGWSILYEIPLLCFHRRCFLAEPQQMDCSTKRELNTKKSVTLADTHLIYLTQSAKLDFSHSWNWNVFVHRMRKSIDSAPHD